MSEIIHFYFIKINLQHIPCPPGPHQTCINYMIYSHMKLRLATRRPTAINGWQLKRLPQLQDRGLFTDLESVTINNNAGISNWSDNKVGAGEPDWLVYVIIKRNEKYLYASLTKCNFNNNDIDGFDNLNPWWNREHSIQYIYESTLEDNNKIKIPDSNIDELYLLYGLRNGTNTTLKFN